LLELGDKELQVDVATGVRISVEPVETKVFMGELLDKFYNRNDEQPPLVFRLTEEPNPVVANSKFWQCVMRGSFVIEIEQGRELGGPHSAKLHFRNFTPPVKATWLASCQLMAFYFNENQMREELMRAVHTREFFMLPKNRDIAIDL
jgi:hypothetical protein